MDLEVAISEQDDILLMNVTGSYSLSDFKELIEMVHKECRTREKKYALVDISSTGVVPFGLDRYILGEYLSEVLGQSVKLAVVNRPEVIDRMAENVAVNRGARMRAFSSRDEAMKWLKG